MRSTSDIACQPSARPQIDGDRPIGSAARPLGNTFNLAWLRIMSRDARTDHTARPLPWSRLRPCFGRSAPRSPVVASPPAHRARGPPEAPRTGPSANLCRERSCGDRWDPSRELGPLSSPAPPATAPESGPGAVASNRGARASVQRSAPAWLALVQYLDAGGNVRDVCVGTGEAATSGGGTSAATQVRYYLDRPRSAGDFHGQAPLLWTASALMH
jgi:hypothetical protein